MGRPAHRPTLADRRQVEMLAGSGVREVQIAGLIGIDPKTLRKHYRSELDHGHTRANAKVAENLFRIATGDGYEAVTAAIFWLKTRADWIEPCPHHPVHRSDHDSDPVERIRQMIHGPASMPHGTDDAALDDEDDEPGIIEHDQRERGRTGHG
ncbi:MAG: hypothetical protein R3D65_17025 [Zhengella sp.]|uniref:hypothetical protein n=1 Tax=Zhengella sp. TaxID=2282762 RepID=UPI001D726B6F|nr:hypothetical protein [Notoacmeibacter sp.]MCC0028509.1 hypothetical protein [Brucellaceae bacterium]